MEFKSEILSSLLRIITPRVITQLSTASSGKKKVSLSLIIENYCEDGEVILKDDSQEEESNILEFPTAKSDIEGEEAEEGLVEEKMTFRCAERSIDLLEQFKARCREMDKSVLGPKRLPRRKLETTTESSSNILEQKRKFEKSNHLLKSREVLSLYKSTSKVTVTGKKRDQGASEEDKNNLLDRERGILVNKKQA